MAGQAYDAMARAGHRRTSMIRVVVDPYETVDPADAAAIEVERAGLEAFHA